MFTVRYHLLYDQLLPWADDGELGGSSSTDTVSRPETTWDPRPALRLPSRG